MSAAPGSVTLLDDPIAKELLSSTIPAKLGKAHRMNPKVALTVDDNTFPHKVLMVRGTAALNEVAGIVPEYELAAHRYFGDVQGAEWIFKSRFPGTLH